MPEELSQQIPYLHALIKAQGFLYIVFRVQRQMTLSVHSLNVPYSKAIMYLSQPEIKTYQLVNDYVKLEDSFKDRVLDTDGVFEKFGVLLNQIIDYLTLMGDASDGIMGVPGVGAKTAAKLLTEYGTLDNIIANVDQLKGKLSQNIKDNLDNIKLDHQLASIVCDLPLELDWHELKLTDPNVDALRTLYTELEFRNQLQSRSSK